MAEPPATSQSPEEMDSGVPLRERYGLVLFLIFLGYVLSGLDDTVWVRILNAVLWLGLLLATLWSPGVPHRVRRIGLVATGLLLLSALSFGFIGGEIATGGRVFLLAVAQVAALLAILSQISQHKRVELQTVLGGVAAYALIAFAMAAVYHGVDLVTSAPAFNGIGDPGDYVYFSFVTITTLGYGDITPATALAKRLVVVESFVGQVFVITLVARLVALWGKPLTK